ncbi:hypothetical protein CLF39_27335, partial [Salmonella enterica subsp. enterica serovar Kottbus]|nr:hypothetical protein [Salmonella enterica subsp. enterica serovar Kottbus]
MTALGMLKAGVPVQIRVTGGTYTIHKMPYRLPEAPSDGTIIDWSSRSMVQFDQAKVEAGRLGQQVPEDWDTIQLPTMASGGERPLYLGLQAASRNVAITRPNQEVDL